MMNERFELNEEMMEEVVGGNCFEEFADNFVEGLNDLWETIFREGDPNQR